MMYFRFLLWNWDTLGLHFIADITLTTVITIVALPFFIISYTVVQSLRRCWIRFIKWKYSNYIIVERNSIHSILDKAKNQAIYTLLIQGNAGTGQEVRDHLHHLVNVKKTLRLSLSTKYGLYAWRYREDFSLDNHLICAPSSFRGRPISDINIQEYVSHVTSKFMPSHEPPWQVHIIKYTTLSNADEFLFYLVRAHHLLLEEENLTLADFLPLQYTSEPWPYQDNDSPFINLYIKPTALPILHQKFTESFNNFWNEFLCNNDPMERPEILKKSIGLFQLMKIFVIILVATSKSLKRCDSKITGRIAVFRCEALKRNFNATTINQAVIKFLDPARNTTAIIHWLWYILIISILKIPILIINELRALYYYHKHCYPDTLTAILSCYVPLIFKSFVEILTIVKIIFTSTRTMLEQLFSNDNESNKLQTISPCGRKIVAWSSHIDSHFLERISSVTGASHVEILLAAIIDSLKIYFQQSGQITPIQILTAATYLSHRALFIKDHELHGLVCLSLPTTTPHLGDDILEILQVIKNNLMEAKIKQKTIYAITATDILRQVLTASFPSVFIKIILNHLTRKYSIFLTHVDGDLHIDGVTTAIYWSPPQGNCNLSITLHRHGPGYRLGVMADALINPQHSIITKTFPHSIEKLAKILGVAAPTASRDTSPDIFSPTTSPGH